MARPGITKEDVFAAATQLIGQGNEPTIEQVRQILQTGSNSTIANHLREWRKEQDGTQALALHSNLPQEAVAMLKGLWERLNQIAEDKCTFLETQHQQGLAELRQELEKYKANNHRWQQMYNQWGEEKNQLISAKSTSENALQLLQQDFSALTATHDLSQRSLDEKQERIEELNRLHKQAQANLEHYRESAREQRLLDQQQYEKNKQEIQAEIKTLKDQNITLKEKVSSLQEEKRILQQDKIFIEQENARSLLLVEKLQSQLSEIEKERTQYLKSSEHWQNLQTETLKTLETKNSQYINNQIEIKLLTEQLASLKQEFSSILEDKKLLTSDKWSLAQEKSALEGQLKQLQQMIKQHA